MWIIPNNYRPSSAFVPATLESKEDLTLPGLDIALCVMWRSKPSPLRTWLQRWNRVSWLPHLFTRILKPSQRTSFETELTLSLPVIRASRSPLPATEKVPTTPDTCDRLLSVINNLETFQLYQLKRPFRGMAKTASSR